MDFPAPVVIGSPVTTPNMVGASVGISLPTPIAGKLLYLTTYYFGSSGYNVAGWTLVATAAASDSNSAIASWVKKAVGGDTATLTTNNATSQNGAAIAYQIDNWSQVIADITGTASNGGAGSATPNPPSHTGLYTRNNLWIASGDYVAVNTNSAPSGYDNLQTALWATSVATLETAQKTAVAKTEDPGAFGGAGTFTAMMTVCIPPPRMPDLTVPPARRIRASCY